MKSLSLRKTLFIGIFSVGLTATLIVGIVGILSLSRNVRREAQERVNLDLRTLLIQYRQNLAILGERFGNALEEIDLRNEEELAGMLPELRDELGFTILNICSPEGVPVAGSYPDAEVRISPGSDPVIRRALEGTAARGTVKLSRERLLAEGGEELAHSAVVPRPEGGEPATESALFLWCAVPVFGMDGAVAAIAYGGRMLNHNYELADRLRDMLFGTEQYKGKPVGTVTLFLDDVRVATNVLGPHRRRAIGTRVSDEVSMQVLRNGEAWQDRAYVVDSWYISGYQPLIDPGGSINGMLYVGLLEEPYDALMREQIFRTLLPVLLVLLTAAGVSLIIVRRTTRPVRELGEAARRIGEGEWDAGIPATSSFQEINDLDGAFRDMQRTIRERDRRLRGQNEILRETNANYMKMLQFISHELKSPLAAMQTMTSVVLENLTGDISDETRSFIERMHHSAEEMQDMVKNYLDLSRIERGEMEAHPDDINFRTDVIDAACEQARELFKSRNISLEIDVPGTLPVRADPELLRLVTGNFLSNAAKYGRENGSARLCASLEPDMLTVSLRNEGEGFTREEREKLFQKFSRLRNETTIRKRGSGLGLFLCREIIEMHGGEIDASSEPGVWAEFRFTIPAGREKG